MSGSPTSGPGRRVARHRQTLGAAGENAVARWYEHAGYSVLDRNWRCREGELDLVLARDRDVVFCEVKTRSGTTFGAPVEAITRSKRQRLRVLAARWLEAHPGEVAADVRIDVASVTRGSDGRFAVEVITGAC